MLGAKLQCHAWSSMRPVPSSRPTSQFLPITREEKRRCSNRTQAVDRTMDEQVPGDASSVSSDERRHDGPAGPPSSSWRWILALSTIAILICYADRTNISVAIVPMSQELGWSEQYKGTVLSVFFIGYAATQMLGGTLADEYGGKRVMAAGVVLWSLFTFLTPISAAMGTVFLISCRIAMGLGEGVAFPAVHAVISATVPRERQSTAVAIVTAASYTGTTIASGLSPMIISYMSWQAVFYIFGASATLWLPFWFTANIPKQKAPETASLPALETEDRPAPVSSDLEDRSASSQVVELPSTDTDQLIDRRQAAASTEIAALPHTSEFARILGSMGMDSGFIALTKRKEVWAICAAQYCNSWGAYALLNWLPTYFSEQYNVGLDQLGEYTVLPPLAQVITGSISGLIADYLIQQGYSVKAVRRYLQVVGMLGPALCLLAVSSPSTGSSAASASILITVALGLNALTLGAVSVSQLDIAPRHAGSIFGLGNTFATLAGFLSTRLTGDILQITGSWAVVFSVTAVHFIAGSVAWWVWVGDSQLPEDKLS